MSIIEVHSIFSAINTLEEMEFARRRYDKEEGCIEWRNMHGDRAEIIVDRHLKCYKIDIYCCSYGPISKGEKMNGKDKKPASPPPNLSEQDKAWNELEQAWKQSGFNPEQEPEEEQPTEDEKK